MPILIKISALNSLRSWRSYEGNSSISVQAIKDNIDVGRGKFLLGNIESIFESPRCLANP